jgi:hypothetical protein
MSSPGWTRTTVHLLVREPPSPLGHGTVDEKPNGLTGNCTRISGVRNILLPPSAFLLPHRSAASVASCWTISPIRAEAVGLEPTSESCSPPVFKTGSSAGRMTSVNIQVAGAGIEPALPGSEPGVATNGDSPALSCRQGHEWFREGSPVAGAGIEPADSRFKAADFYQQKLPRIARGTGGTRTRALVLNRHPLCR